MKSVRTRSLGPLALVVVALAVGAARADVKSGEKALLEALKKADDSSGVQKACDELIAAGGREAVQVILKVLPKVAKSDSATGYYWQLIGGASGFPDKGALEEVGKFILSNGKNPLGKDLLFGLQNNHSNYVTVPLALVLEKGPYDLQLMAVDQLGNVRTSDTVDILIDALKREKSDKELRRRIDAALVCVTGEDVGIESWESWWQNQKPKGLPEKKSGGDGEQAGAPSGGGTRSRDITGLNKVDPKSVVVISNDRTMIKDRPKDAPASSPDAQEKSYRNYDYDHMEQVLDALNIPHVVVQKQEFDKDPQSVLKSAYCVLVNCSNISMQCVCDKCTPTNNAAGNRMMQCDPKCTHVNAKFCMKDESVQALKKWVEDGGYLFTEDMGVIEIIEKAWPNLVTTKMIPAPEHKNMVDGAGKPLGDKKPLQVREATVKLEPGKGNTTHPLMRGVWVRPKSESEKAREAAEGAGGTQEKSPAKALEHMWKIDDESPAFEVVDRKLVVVLLESTELGKLEADQSGESKGENGGGRVSTGPVGPAPVAVTFRVGRGSNRQATGKGSGEWAIGGAGRVLHTMSHFGKQDSSQDGQALRNLILNFLVEAQKQWQMRKGK